MTPIPDKLIKYKELIKPKNYYPDLLADYLNSNYSCENITSTFKTEVAYKVILNNLNIYLGNVDSINPIIMEIKKDEKSRQLYQDFDGSDTSYIYVFLDKESGFFDSNSNELLYELTIEKSVSEEDYENETMELIRVLDMMYTEMNGINEDDIWHD